MNFRQVWRPKVAPWAAVPEAAWALEGRVYNTQLRPASDYIVFFVDILKNYVSGCGFAYTDTTGYFLIDVPGNAALPPGKTLFVQVATRAGNPVYLSALPFYFVPGMIAYQSITLQVSGTATASWLVLDRYALFPRA